MRYRLRTLLLLLAIGPPMLAGAWIVGSKALANYRARRNAVVWEDVGGPGVIDTFSWGYYGCSIGDDGQWVCTFKTADSEHDVQADTQPVLP